MQRQVEPRGRIYNDDVSWYVMNLDKNWFWLLFCASFFFCEAREINSKLWFGRNCRKKNKKILLPLWISQTPNSVVVAE